MNHSIHQQLRKLKQEKRHKAQRFELAVKRRYLKEQETGNSSDSRLKIKEDRRIKPDGGAKFKNKKPLPFQKERKQFQKQVQERKASKQQLHREIEKKQALSQKQRALKKRKYGQRNSKGQPRMKHMIQNLLGKIEKTL